MVARNEISVSESRWQVPNSLLICQQSGNISLQCRQSYSISKPQRDPVIMPTRCRHIGRSACFRMLSISCSLLSKISTSCLGDRICLETLSILLKKAILEATHVHFLLQWDASVNFLSTLRMHSPCRSCSCICLNRTRPFFTICTGIPYIFEIINACNPTIIVIIKIKQALGNDVNCRSHKFSVKRLHVFKSLSWNGLIIKIQRKKEQNEAKMRFKQHN